MRGLGKRWLIHAVVLGRFLSLTLLSLLQKGQGHCLRGMPDQRLGERLDDADRSGRSAHQEKPIMVAARINQQRYGYGLY